MINGVINIYKPQNITSNYVVIRIKKLLNIKKIGHTGTLDPLACGVLPICIGSATKISEYLLNKDKVYSVKIKFGILTDTYDREGNITKMDLEFILDKNKLLNVLNGFIGEQEQVPPNYSALKVNGKRAYELARGGIEFELKSRKIVVYFINSVVVNEENNECSFTIKCSKGTYIRSLCRDIAKAMGTYGTITFLERVESGNFKKDTALDFETIDSKKIRDNLILIDDIIDYPKIEINDPDIIKLLMNGVSVKNPKYIHKIAEGIYLLYTKGNLIGICERKMVSLRVIKFLSQGNSYSNN